MTGIERVGFYNPWLYPLAAESARTEILKMTGTANERASHLREITACQEANLRLKRVNPIKGTSAVSGTKRVSPGCDHLGRNIDISLLLWYEIALGFLAAFLLALYLAFDFIESILLALVGTALGIYFHEMHHFVTARRLVLGKKLHEYLPHGVGLFHRELIRAMKGEPSNSYIRINIDKRGIGVIYPQQILSREENLKAKRSGFLANARLLVLFTILGVIFYLAFIIIAFPSLIQGLFSTFREGMKKNKKYRV